MLGFRRTGSRVKEQGMLRPTVVDRESTERPADIAFGKSAPRALLVRISGEFSGDVVDALPDGLDRRLGASRFRRLVLNLSQVTSLAPPALNSLLRLRRRCRIERLHPALVGVAQPAGSKPLRMSGALPLFDIRPTVESATRPGRSGGRLTPPRCETGRAPALTVTALTVTALTSRSDPAHPTLCTALERSRPTPHTRTIAVRERPEPDSAPDERTDDGARWWCHAPTPRVGAENPVTVSDEGFRNQHAPQPQPARTHEHARSLWSSDSRT
jgi:anti-anti-sigma factor